MSKIPPEKTPEHSTIMTASTFMTVFMQTKIRVINPHASGQKPISCQGQDKKKFLTTCALVQGTRKHALRDSGIVWHRSVLATTSGFMACRSGSAINPSFPSAHYHFPMHWISCLNFGWTGLSSQPRYLVSSSLAFQEPCVVSATHSTPRHLLPISPSDYLLFCSPNLSVPYWSLLLYPRQRSCCSDQVLVVVVVILYW